MVEGLGWNANADGARAQRELISQLEAKNREIMQEITRLRFVLVFWLSIIYYCSVCIFLMYHFFM